MPEQATLPVSAPGGHARPEHSRGRLPRRARRFTRHRSWAYIFAAPAALAIAAGLLYPLGKVIWLSFYSGSLGDLVYVGTANYAGLWQDPVFFQSLFNNIRLLATVPIMAVLALVIALMLNAQVRGWRQYRAIVFLPYILPATAIGLVFSYILERNGVLNTELTQWHLGFLTRDWLGSAASVVPTIGGVIIWQQLGFGVVVFAAALLAVPQELLEAARLDGATGWQIQHQILIPYIRRTIEFFMVIEGITILSSIFTYVFVLTKGGPANASSVLEYYIFNNGFENGALGLASAAVVVLLLMACALVAAYLRLRARGSD